MPASPRYDGLDDRAHSARGHPNRRIRAHWHCVSFSDTTVWMTARTVRKVIRTVAIGETHVLNENGLCRPKKHTCSSLAISRIFLNNRTIRWKHHTLYRVRIKVWRTTKIIGNARHKSVAIMIEKWVNFKRDYLEISFLRENCGYDGSDDRRVYNYGYNFGGTGVFHFFAFMHSFQKLVSELVIFKPYVVEETVIEKALHANECVWDE